MDTLLGSRISALESGGTSDSPISISIEKEAQQTASCSSKGSWYLIAVNKLFVLSDSRVPTCGPVIPPSFVVLSTSSITRYQD